MLTTDKKRQIKIFLLNDGMEWQEFDHATLHLDLLEGGCALRVLLTSISLYCADR